MYEGVVQDLIDELGRLPGVGPKSAQRIAFHLLAADPAVLRLLGADPLAGRRPTAVRSKRSGSYWRSRASRSSPVRRRSRPPLPSPQDAARPGSPGRCAGRVGAAHGFWPGDPAIGLGTGLGACASGPVEPLLPGCRAAGRVWRGAIGAGRETGAPGLRPA